MFQLGRYLIAHQSAVVKAGSAAHPLDNIDEVVELPRAMGRSLLLIALVVAAPLALARLSFGLAAYPWCTPYSFSWLARGLEHALGPSVQLGVMDRKSLFSPLLGLLFHSELIDLLPLFGLVCHLAAALLLYALARRTAGQRVAFWGALFLLLSYTPLAQSAYVGADMAVTVLLIGLAFLALHALLAVPSTSVWLGSVVAAILLQVLYVIRNEAAAVPEEPLIFPIRLVAGFSWPIVLLAGVGLCGGLKDARSRPVTAFLAFWVVDVTVLLSFVDSTARFLAYASAPLCTLAGRGVTLLWARPSDTWGALRNGGLIGLAVFFVTSPPTTDPTDLSLALTPFHSVTVTQRGNVTSSPQRPMPYVIRHLEEALAQARAGPLVDTVTYSAPLHRLLGDLSREGQTTGATSSLVVYQDGISPEHRETIRNRNMLYARGPAELVWERGALLKLVNDRDVVLVARADQVDGLQRRWLTFAPMPLGSAVGGYRVFRSVAGRGAVVDGVRDVTPPFVASVTAEEHTECLFDSISSIPTNWTASRLGHPIEILFTQPVRVRQLRIHLWDFDSRWYRFTVAGLASGTWSTLTTREGRGALSVGLGEAMLQGLRIVGSYNSDQEHNPANTVLHLKELEIAGVAR